MAIYNERLLPKYEFIDYSSQKDIDAIVEIEYNECEATHFYVGNAGTDMDSAVKRVVKYLEENNILEHYIAIKPELHHIEGYCFKKKREYIHDGILNMSVDSLSCYK